MNSLAALFDQRNCDDNSLSQHQNNQQDNDQSHAANDR